MLLKLSFFRSLPTLRSCKTTSKRSLIRSRRSAQRQRTTPSFSRSGPASIHVPISRNCSPVRRGLRPVRERSDSAQSAPPRCSDVPSLARSGDPCRQPALPTDVSAHPAPWRPPKYAVSAAGQNSAPPLPEATLHRALHVRSPLKPYLPPANPSTCTWNRRSRVWGIPPGVKNSAGWYKRTCVRS